MNKKLKLATTLTVGLPMITVMACASSNFEYERGDDYDISAIAKGFGDKYKHGKVMSSYWVSTDMYAALGYIPEYASISGNKIYADYLKPWLGDNNNSTTVSTPINTGKYTITSAPTIMDGKQVDRETIHSYNISTLLLNEWEQIDEHKFTDIVPALIYTTMADGYGRRSSKQIEWEWEKNIYEAYYMQAKGMDRAYPDGDVANKYYKKALSDVKKIEENIKWLDKKIPIKESIIVLDLGFDESNTVNKISTYGPSAYNPLYSKDDGFGIGMEFPSPVAGHEDNLNKNSWNITSDDVPSFTAAYEGRVDRIVVNINNRWTTTQKAAAELYVTNNSDLHKMLSTGKNPSNHISTEERTDWYEAPWGIMGTESFIQTLRSFYNVDEQVPNITIFDKDITRTVMTPNT